MSLTGVEAGSITIGPVAVHQHQHFHGEGYARSRYRADIHELIERYDDRFVGRSRELARLATFVRDPIPGHLIVEAAGGQGKSALMAQLLLRAERGEIEGCRPAVVVFFVRDPGGNQPADFLTAVNGQLLFLLERPGGTPYDLRALRTQFSELWAEAQSVATAERPLLLLLDGLDEQAEGDLTIAHVVPASLGTWVHVVVSSRPRPDVRERVGGDHPLRTAQTLVLDGLASTDVQQLLTRGGLASQEAEELAARIHALAHGEALLARHICDDVLARGSGILDHIEASPPRGIHDYFLREVRGIDQAADADATWNACALLAVARGPLSLDEIADVLGVGRRQARRALEPVDRYLLGRDRLQFFHRNLYTTILDEIGGKDAATWRTRLVAWCRGAADTTPVPRYALEHYGAHLASERRGDELLALVSRLWLQEHRRELHTLTGFARDVDAAYELCAAPATAPPRPLDALRMAVLLGSLGSTAQNVPPEAVWLLARVGRVDEANGYATLAADAVARAKALAALADGLIGGPEESCARQVVDQALDIALGPDRTSAMDEAITTLAGAALRCQDAAVWQAVLTRLLALDPATPFDLHTMVRIAEHAHRVGATPVVERVRHHVSTTLAWFEATMARYLATRAHLHELPAPQGVEPFDMDADTLEEAEDTFYTDLASVAEIVLTASRALNNDSLSPGVEALVTAMPEGFQRAADLARLAQARAERGDTAGALTLARRAIELPEAGPVNAVVPERYVISQLAACVPILARDTFADVQGELVSHIAALASTLPPQHWHAGHESLVAAWTATGRADDIESLHANTLPTDCDYASYSLRGLHAAIALGLAACGRLDRAAEVMEVVPPDVTRDTDRLALIGRFLEAGRVDLGERTLARVYYRPNRVAALATVAAGVERLGRRDEALAWLDRTLTAATAFGDDTTRVALYAEAGRALLTGGRRDAAARLVDRALAINTPLPADQRSSESDVSLALLLIDLGDIDGFLRVAPRRGDNWGMRYLARYAEALMARQGFHALSTFFFEVVAEEPAYRSPGDALEHLAIRARVLWMLGYTTKATELFEAALSTMQDMDRRSESVHGRGVGAVARYLRESGEPARASTVLEQGLQRGFQLFEEESLAHVARAFADLGLHDRATTVATAALASIDFTASYTNTDGIHDALMALAPEDLPEAVRALVARAQAAGRPDYVRLAATYGVQALHDRQRDGLAIALLFEPVPLFRGEPRGSLLWSISRWSPLVARLDADGLARLCDWVEEVTGWWERA